MAAPKSIPSLRPFEPDERQRQAIEHVGGPMLVVAGAGTGKTTVLIKRIAHLVRNAGVRPDEILAVTYTDNAAKEMRERVEAELRGTDISGLQAKTFHAYCNEMLEKRGKKFDLIEDCDLWIYLRRQIRKLNLKYFVRAANVSQFLGDLLEFMRRCQDELVGPEQYAEFVKRVECGDTLAPKVAKAKQAADLTEADVHGRCREIAGVFSTVEGILREKNLGTFSHMITRAHDLLHSNPLVLAEERKRTRFILVDEFQDANFAQVKIVQMLAGDDRNVFAVGDPDQAIYRFRGASSAAFALFQNHFEGAKLVVLEKNRRSTTPILRAAFSIISQNPNAFSTSDGGALAYKRTPLLSAREEDAVRDGVPLTPAPVEIIVAKELEASDVIATIRERKRRERCAWKDFAVLSRSHVHRDDIVRALSEQGIPFTIDNMDVRDTAEVRDVLACAGGVVSLSDSSSLFRVAALPQFKVDPEKLRAGVRAIPRDTPDASVAPILEQTVEGRTVLDVLRQAREEIEDSHAKAYDALKIIIKRFGIDDSTRPIVALLDFVSHWEKKILVETGLLSEFLEYLIDFRAARGSIPLVDTDEDAVKLITAHGAKGLEFKHVFVVRVISSSFPASFREPLFEFPQALRDPGSAGQGEDKTLNDQEERRLFYVAMTRARDSLTLYGPKGRGKVDPTPPGFLRELIKDRAVSNWVRQRSTRGFQTEIFAVAADPGPLSRTKDWVELPPSSDLSKRLSPSAVANYEKCPLQFKLEREWRLPTEPPAPLQYGASMHRVLRTYYDSVRFSRPMDDEAVIELFRSDLAAAGLQDTYQFELYEKQGIEQLRDFLALSREAPPSVLHTEESFEVPLETTTVVGRIDRVDQLPDGTVVITDYKTGKPQDQEDADKSLQLSIYALAAREKWGYRADRLVLYNLTENTMVTSARSQAEIERAKDQILKVAASIAAGKFDAKPGPYCDYCGYRNLCPATEKRLPKPDSTHN